jgi:hypothetical protein
MGPKIRTSVGALCVSSPSILNATHGQQRGRNRKVPFSIRWQIAARRHVRIFALYAF